MNTYFKLFKIYTCCNDSRQVSPITQLVFALVCVYIDKNKVLPIASYILLPVAGKFIARDTHGWLSNVYPLP